jgi:hypothetical protein
LTRENFLLRVHLPLKLAPLQCYKSTRNIVKFNYTDQIFPIQIGSDEIWGVVKNAIKEDQKPEFDDIASKTLKLWKVRHCAISHVVAQLPIQKVTIGRSQRSRLESKDFLNSVTATNPLDPIGPLSTDFNQPVPLHTPEKGKKDFQDSIQLFLNDCRPAMETLVSKAGDIPSFMASWTPGSSMDPRLSDHIRRLNIPRDKGGLPSLLLHDLGEEKSDLDRLRASRIPGIFSNINTCVVHFVMVHFHISCVFRLLINTSGSGKSRILLEGLCRHWGFYFVAVGSSIVGSSDFYATFSTINAARDYSLARNLKGIDPLAFPHMGNTTERRLLQLLLSRLLLLNLFIEVAKCSPTGLQQKEHRRLWTLLQVHPEIIKGHFCGDIFADLTGRLRHTTSENLMNLVKEAHTKLCDLLAAPNGELTLFTVLDEVQEALTLCMGACVGHKLKAWGPESLTLFYT